MNKERYNQIIDEVYDKYTTKYIGYDDVPSKELFLFEIRTNKTFSEKWGLQIEERELSNDERFRIAYKNLDLRKELEAQSKMLHYPDGHNKAMDNANIPTKLITIKYNDKKIESYE
jgi:hypothetical protein